MKNAIIIIAAFLTFESLSAQNFWQPINVPSGVLAVNASGHIFAPSDHMFRSKDNGNSWTVIDSGLPTNWSSTGIAISPSGEVFVGLVDLDANRSRLFRSTNNGHSWFERDSGWGNAWISDIAFAPNGSIFLASDYGPPLSITSVGNINYGMFRSTDGGSTWAHVGLFSTFSIAISNGGVIFAGDRGGRFRSTDNGDTWHRVLGLSTGWFGFERSHLGHIIALGSPQGFRSKDEGSTWSVFGTFPVWATTFNGSAEIFVGNLSGVFRSTNDGASWSPINSGLTNPATSFLVINANGFVFARTDGGLFRSVNPITVVEQRSDGSPGMFVLEQNYPNPFNPSTNIRFAVTGSGFVTLKVYNLLGQEVRTLVNENLHAGGYEVTFDATGLASGTYFYRLQAGDFVQTKKLLLLR